MKTYLTYGGLAALGGFLVTLTLYFTGVYDHPGQSKAMEWTAGLINLGIMITCITLGTRARRAQVPPHEEFGYGRAFLSGFLITVFAALIGVAGTLLYFGVIDPGYAERAFEVASTKATRPIPPEAEKIIRLFMSAPVMAAIGLFLSLFCGTIISLISAAFQKRAANELAPPAMS